MENIKEEKYINNAPEPLSIDATEKILEQMKKCICKIYNVKEGTGFFIRIPYKKSTLSVLITNNHIIEEKDIIDNKIITIYLDYEKKERNLQLDKERLWYTNIELDTTIIEIKENSDNIQYFLELDDKIKDCMTMNKDDISNFLKNIYSNKSIYLINYPGKEVVVSYGQPPKYKSERMEHKCSTQKGSSGSPILLANNQKVIGIHYGAHKTESINFGLLIIYPIIEFNKKEIIPKKNEIKKKNEIIQIKGEKIKLSCLFGKSFLENNFINCEITTENVIYLNNEIKYEKIKEICCELLELCQEIYEKNNKEMAKYLVKFS